MNPSYLLLRIDWFFHVSWGWTTLLGLKCRRDPSYVINSKEITINKIKGNIILDVSTLSFPLKQHRKILFHFIFHHPGGFLEPKVCPLQFNLGNGSIPKCIFPPIKIFSRLKLELSLYFDLQNILIDNMCRIMNICFQYRHMKYIVNPNVHW